MFFLLDLHHLKPEQRIMESDGTLLQSDDMISLNTKIEMLHSDDTPEEEFDKLVKEMVHLSKADGSVIQKSIVDIHVVNLYPIIDVVSKAREQRNAQ